MGCQRPLLCFDSQLASSSNSVGICCAAVCGACLGNSGDILQPIFKTPDAANLATLPVAAGLISFTLLAAGLMDRAGRVKLLFISSIGKAQNRSHSATRLSTFCCHGYFSCAINVLNCRVNLGGSPRSSVEHVPLLPAELVSRFDERVLLLLRNGVVCVPTGALLPPQ